MVPPATDERWRRFVTQKFPNFTMLATRIMFARVRVLVGRGDEESLREAIAVAHDYFVRNEKLAACDLKL